MREKQLEEVSGIPVKDDSIKVEDSKVEVTKEVAPKKVVKKVVKKEKVYKRGERRSLPTRRGGYNQKVRIDGSAFYIRTGEYEDGTLGEIFIDCSKSGSSMRAMMGAVAISVSLGLQYGVPLEAFVKVFKNYGFIPAGFIQGDDRFTEVQSVLDYLARELEFTYLSPKEKS